MRHVASVLAASAFLWSCGAANPAPTEPVATTQPSAAIENRSETRIVEPATEVDSGETALANSYFAAPIFAKRIAPPAQQPPRRPPPSPPPPSPPPRPTPSKQPDPKLTYSVPVAGAASQGASDALVTIVRGYEYACPYCAKSQATMDELLKIYGSDLRVVYLSFIIHPQTATASALAACAANRQGRFDDMNTALWAEGFTKRSFDTQASGTVACWETSQMCPLVGSMASTVGLEMVQFGRDFFGDCKREITDQRAVLEKVGMRATPGFYINGRFISGAQQLATFTTLIDEELALANKRLGKKPSKKKRAGYYKKYVVDAGVRSIAP